MGHPNNRLEAESHTCRLVSTDRMKTLNVSRFRTGTSWVRDGSVTEEGGYISPPLPRMHSNVNYVDLDPIILFGLDNDPRVQRGGAKDY